MLFRITTISEGEDLSFVLFLALIISLSNKSLFIVPVKIIIDQGLHLPPPE